MEIKTERLTLRPFEEKDANDLYDYLHEPQVNCFASMRLNTLEDAEQEIRNRQQNSSEEYFAIVLKEEEKVIGEICSCAESTDPANLVKDTYSPCWMLNKEYQGKGYMYEAAEAVFDYLFHEKSARRIYVYTEDYNIACQKLSENLGMRKEGLFQEFVSFVKDKEGNPIYENTYQYAILKKEWDNRKLQ